MLLKPLASAAVVVSLAAGGALAAKLPAPDTRLTVEPPLEAPTDGTPSRVESSIETAPAPEARLEAEAETTERVVPVRVGDKETIRAAEAGDVTVLRDELGLKLQLVGAAQGWVPEVERESGSLIEIVFRADTRRILLRLLPDGSAIRVKLVIFGERGDEARHRGDDAEGRDDDATTTTTEPATTTSTEPRRERETRKTVHPVAEAGAVELNGDGRRLLVAKVKLNVGWTYTVERPTGLEVVVRFLNGAESVVFRAVLDHAQVKTKVLLHGRQGPPTSQRPEAEEPEAEEPEAEEPEAEEPEAEEPEAEEPADAEQPAADGVDAGDGDTDGEAGTQPSPDAS